MTSRWYAPTVLAVLACGGLAFFAASRAWETRTLRTEGLPSDVVTVTGNDAHPLVGALALVVVAGALAVLATGGRARRAVGVVIAVAAAGALATIVTGRDSLDRAFDAAVRESPAFIGSESVDGTGTPWAIVAAAALLVAVVLGLLTARVGHRWPTMGGRYDAPGARRESVKRVNGRPEDAAGSQLWAELDEGRDPTE